MKRPPETRKPFEKFVAAFMVIGLLLCAVVVILILLGVIKRPGFRPAQPPRQPASEAQPAQPAETAIPLRAAPTTR